MRAYDVILKKRNGQALTAAEIEFMVKGYVSGLVPDYQMAAFLMAIFFRGLDSQELAHLTNAMVASGETLDLSFVPGRKVDKHSSGGVGDKTSLVVCPLVAACGVPVAKMTGRALGHTGGTIDKLESIPGFQTSLSPAQFRENVERLGIALVGQTRDLVPADGLMYALRDVIAAVDSIPLIASSIMSKKIAGGADAIVLDVKAGSGAFMKTDADAIALAETMVRIGREVGRETVALVTAMEQPLGCAVGNALEVAEAIETLKGGGPGDFVELSLALASEMVSLGKGIAVGAARSLCEAALSEGRALAKFREMVQAQGGEPAVVDEPASVLPRAPVALDVLSPATGYVAAIDALLVGQAAALLGAGRARKGDPIDHAAGLILRRKTADRIVAGECLATAHTSTAELAREAQSSLLRAFVIGEERPLLQPVVRHRLDGSRLAAKN